MSLDSTLKTVISRLRSNDLENEEEVKLAVILPTLLALDWNPTDSGSIKPEYSVGQGRVDYALLCHGRPQVFIEAKRRGAVNVRAEGQLFSYASNQGIPLLVLTDGYYWDFYLSMADGLPEERRFRRLELSHEDKISEYMECLESLLRKGRVASGEARRSAEAYLERNRERARARKAIPSAWNSLLGEPDELLRELLAEKVQHISGAKPNPEDVDEFLMSLPSVSVRPPRDGSLTEVKSVYPAGEAGIPGHGSVAAGRHGTTIGAYSQSTHNESGKGETLQSIIYDFMHVVLEQYPDILDEETMYFLQVEKNPLGLRLGYPLIRKISEGRELKGYSRYKIDAYAERWYVCTEWNKPYRCHNSWLNSRFVCICDRIPGTSGGWIMDIRGFQVWLSAARGLTRAQRREALAVLSGRSEGEASKAAIELGVDEARRCPHCASEGAVSRGMARGLRRYQCKGCGRTFNALSGTPLSGLHHKERWLSFGASLAKGETVKASAARCDVAVSTAFRWRHRFLAAARSDSEVLKGIVEADETHVLESRKGARGLGRKARRRGGKAKKRGLAREQVPVLMAADRSGTTVSAVLPRVDAAALAAALDPVVAKDALLVSDGGASYPPCAAALGVSHETLNRSMGERVRGDLHVQTVNSRHSRLKDFLRPRRGIATRYLDNYLSWFHLVGLAPGANDRACLDAAITR